MNDVKQNNIPPFNAEIGKLLDDKAVDLKKKNENYTRAYIVLLFLGAFFADMGGLIDDTISIFAAVICTFSSFFIYRLKFKKNLVEQWTYTRVIAETIKSEWFKYFVGGGDYPIKQKADEETALETFNTNIKRFMDEYKKNIHSVGGDYIEPNDLLIDMKSNTYRDKTLAERLEYYRTSRMENQKIWYESKSKLMRKKVNKYNSTFKVVVGFGTLVGILMWLDLLQNLNIPYINNADFFSIFIAFAFAFDSFSSISQYERLSIVYKKSYYDLTESIQELTGTNNDISTSEAVFNEFVEDIENKISNEHKSWSLTTSTKNIHSIS